MLGHYDYAYVPMARHVIFHDAAVDIFFCLSSFTLCLVYGAGSGRALALRDFAIARIARIYPVYLLTLLLSVAILVVFDRGVFGPAHLGDTILRLVWQALLLAALPIPSLIGFWDIPAWSVSVEAFCYAVIFPPIFRASRTVAGWPPALLIAAIFLCAGLDFLVFTNAYQANILGIGYGSASRMLSYWVPLLRGMTMFLAGWLAFVLLGLLPGLTARFVADGVAAAFAAIVILAAHGYVARQSVVFLAPWLVLGLMNDRAVASRLLSTRPVVFLGRISYSLYLVHVPVLIAYHARPLFQGGGVADFYAPFAISLGLATLSYRFFEAPSRRFIRARFAGRAATVGARQ